MRFFRIIISILLLITISTALHASFSASSAYLASGTMSMYTESAPDMPGTISGLAKPCPNSTQTYSISSVPDAAGYNWVVPTGMTISTNNGTSIIVQVGSTCSGTLKVRAYNSYGYSDYRTRTITQGTFSVAINSGSYLGDGPVEIAGDLYYELPNTNGNAGYAVTSNTDGLWNVTESTSWLTAPTNNYSGSVNPVNVAYIQNTSGGSRSTTIFFNCQSKHVEMNVIQYLTYTDFEPVTGTYLSTSTLAIPGETSYTLNRLGGVFKIHIETNVGWTYTKPSWMSTTPTGFYSMGEGDAEFSYIANDQVENTGYFEFFINGVSVEKHYVYQESHDFAPVAVAGTYLSEEEVYPMEGEYFVTQDEGVFKIDLQSSTRSGTISATETWLNTPGSNFNTNNKILSFSFTANNDLNSRSSDITLVSGSTTRYFRVTQQGSRFPARVRPIPDASKNYVYTITPRIQINSYNLELVRSQDATADDYKADAFSDRVAYFDGLGRPLQEVAASAAPDYKSIVKYHVYDAVGREALDYQPFDANAYTTGRPGGYVTNAAGKQEDFYQDLFGTTEGQYAFSEKIFDNSPLNRVMEQSFPGQTWQTEDDGYFAFVQEQTPGTYDAHTVKTIQKTNDEPVNSWIYGNTTASPVEYAVGTLYVTESMDENWSSDDEGGIIREFKDKMGRVVLKETTLDSAASVLTLRTHYIYDKMGMLRCVVPPKANSPNDIDLCYYYTYDERQRMTRKKIPGADSVLMVYDKRDRLVATQDGNMRQTGEWLLMFYDALDRPVITAKKAIAVTRSSMQNTVNGYTSDQQINTVLASNAGNFAFTNSGFKNSYSVQNSHVLTATHYDTYYGYNSTYPIDYPDDEGLNHPIYDNIIQLYTTNIKGLPTVILTRDLGTQSFLVIVNYYDIFKRVVQTVSGNHLGGIDRVSTKYDFISQVLAVVHEHTKNSSGGGYIKEAQRFEYDHTGRLQNTFHQIAGNEEALVSANSYDELGQLENKKLHATYVNGINTPATSMHYDYNIRGWLTRMNWDNDRLGYTNSLFSMALLYDDIQWLNPDASMEAQYNGNISALMYHNYKCSDQTPVFYSYNYDDINRLTKATHGLIGPYSGHTHDNKYDVPLIEFDKNGNITHLKRTGSAGTLIDDMTYTYENGGKSNRLKEVAESLACYANVGFKDIGNQGYTDYHYDSCGNMIYDLNKSITNIVYNYLNLPQTITKTGQNISYTYNASGVKLKNTTGSTTTDYCGNFVYVDGNLEYILMPEGRILVEGTIYKYEYHLKDHLGNTRCVFIDDNNNGTIATSEIKQLADYYPFGMMHSNSSYPASGTQKYLYNGKELQEGTDWLDYGNRFYDPAKPGWLTIDRKAEKYYSISPYVYAIDNPIRFIDPDGNVIVDATNNPITYTAENGWSPNATPDAMRIGNAMMLTPTGTDQFNKMVKTEYNISLNISSEAKTGILGEAELPMTMDGLDAKFASEEGVKITIYEGSIDHDQKNGGEYSEFTKEEAIGAIASHESVHGTDKENIKTSERKAGIDGIVIGDILDRKVEVKPEEVERKYQKEAIEYRMKEKEPISGIIQ